MQPGQSNGNTKKIIAALAVLIIIVVIVFSAKALTSKDDTTGTTPSSSETVTTDPGETNTDSEQSPGDSTASIGTYNDGSYTADGSYDSPGGTESITIKVTLKDGMIAETSAVSGATSGEAQEFQDEFIAGYKKLVVGKSIDDVRLSRVSGSSLTSSGFNRALEEIKKEANAG